MKEGAYRPQTNQPEQTQPLQGNAEGRRSFQGPTTVEGSEPPKPSSGLPLISQEHPTLPQKSALNRSVERTRVLYERNGWVFLPLGEVGKGSPSLSHQPPLSEEFYHHLRERLRRLPQDLEREEVDKFFEKLRSINPEGRKRAQKRLRDYLFGRTPQEPKSEE